MRLPRPVAAPKAEDPLPRLPRSSNRSLTWHATIAEVLDQQRVLSGLVLAETAFIPSGVEPKPLQREAIAEGVKHPGWCPECQLPWICGACQGRPSPRACGQPRRYVVAAPDRHIWNRSKQQWDHICPGRRDFRSATARLTSC